MKKAVFVCFAFLAFAFCAAQEEQEETVQNERIDGFFSVGAYGSAGLPIGEWRETAKFSAGGGIRAEVALLPEIVGFGACLEGAKIFPSNESQINGGLDFSALGGVWARLFSVKRVSLIPSIWAGLLVHSSSGEKSGVFSDFEFRAEASVRIRLFGGLSLDFSPFYIRAAEDGGKVLHGPGVHAGIVFNFGEEKYEIVEVPADSE